MKNKNQYSVYVHIIPKKITKYTHDKYYVGITAKKPQKRWGCNGKGYKEQIFYFAIQKYGWNNIEHEIVASNLTYDEACNMEKILILKLQSNISEYGYNLTKGGEGMFGVRRTKEQINATIEKTSKKVFQFDLLGNYINDFPSVSEAVRKTKCSDSIICSYTNFKNNITGSTKYLWLYEDKVLKEDNEYRIKCFDDLFKYAPHAVYQFDINGVFINKYLNPKIASEITNIPYDIIHGQLRAINTHRTLHDFLWRYSKDIIIEKGTYKIKETKHSKTLGIEIFQFDMNKKFIAKYRNAVEASKNNNISPSTILRHANKKSLYPSKNYFWRHREDIEESELVPDSFFMKE